MENKDIKILLVGTGAVGSYYGGKLQQAGAHVTALCRSDYDIVIENGIYIKSINGNFHFKPDKVIKYADEYSYKADYILVTTKVLPEIDIASIIKPAVSENTVIVLLQNGINIEQPIVKTFPHNEFISALAFICVSRVEYGKIDHQDYGRIVIGNYPKGITPAVETLHNLFQKAEINCTINEDIVAARWIKLVWNAPFNPISVLGGGVTTKEMLSADSTKELIRNIMKEVALLAKASGNPIPESIIDKNISDTEKMTPYKTSMLLDYENKRPLEVEAILGNALKIAKENDIETPYIESIYGLLTIINQKNLE